jgi:hypothetical protein
MASGGRLAISLPGFARATKPITNRLQVANLSHTAVQTWPVRHVEIFEKQAH